MQDLRTNKTHEHIASMLNAAMGAQHSNQRAGAQTGAFATTATPGLTGSAMQQPRVS